MRKCSILFLALLSSGCVIEAQQVQLAKCELEHPRKSRPTPFTDYTGKIEDTNAMTACMRAAGYVYDIHPRKMQSWAQLGVERILLSTGPRPLAMALAFGRLQ